MTDISATPTKHRSPTRRSAEFIFYFSLIFVLAIPFTTVAWAVDVFRRHTLFLHGPLARAWAEADRTTPLIFSVH
mgnify:CR=1 FL=1